MNPQGKTLLAKLEREILPLQGYKSSPTKNDISIGFPPIEEAFPNAVFPSGCMHEFISLSREDVSATSGFIAGLVSNRMKDGGACLWISASRTLFPAALVRYGIQPHQVIFIDVKKEKDVLYATEQALRCRGITAVISEAKEIGFTESRRFQLAAEGSQVMGFLIRHQPKANHTIACMSRWRITSVASTWSDDMPGIGFPRWRAELLKVRNGKPGKWLIQWSAEGFMEIRNNIQLSPQQPEFKIV